MTRTIGCSACRQGRTRERMSELGDSGFIVFTVDDEAELVRVYSLVWIS